jgi:hypothetical protein
MQEGRPLAFTSKQLSKKNLGKPIYEKEMLAILHAIELWRPYLLGQRFQIKTDHQSLKYFLEQRISSQEQCISSHSGSNFHGPGIQATWHAALYCF